MRARLAGHGDGIEQLPALDDGFAILCGGGRDIEVLGGHYCWRDPCCELEHEGEDREESGHGEDGGIACSSRRRTFVGEGGGSQLTAGAGVVVRITEH